MTRHVLAAAIVVTLIGGADATEADARLERTDGSLTRGNLLAIDKDAVTIATDGTKQSIPLTQVRRVILDQTTRAAAAPKVDVVLVNGGTLSGTDIVQREQSLIVTTAEGQTDIPFDRVARVAWLEPAGTAAPWVTGLPPKPTSDLLVVRREGGHEFVECAVSNISADTVSVALDGETIPVQRAKVAGIVWLRDATEPPGGVVVLVRGGRLQAKAIAWSPDGLTVDESLQLPAAALRSIDYAAGRTVALATLSPERVDAEPFFGGLRDVPGLAAFFAPRTLLPPSDDGPAVLLVRPRSVLTYRIPEDSRRFRASIERDVPATATAQVDVVLALDDKEVFRRRIDGALEGKPVTIDADVTGARRLMLTVEFVPGDMGCGLRIIGAAFEK